MFSKNLVFVVFSQVCIHICRVVNTDTLCIYLYIGYIIAEYGHGQWNYHYSDICILLSPPL